MDALYINALGRLILVEVKLWRNPQARREVTSHGFTFVGSPFSLSSGLPVLPPRRLGVVSPWPQSIGVLRTRGNGTASHGIGAERWGLHPGPESRSAFVPGVTHSMLPA